MQSILDKSGNYRIPKAIHIFKRGGVGLHILGDNITVDLKGHSIKGKKKQRLEGTVGILVTGNGVIIKNGSIHSVETAIRISDTGNVVIENVNISRTSIAFSGSRIGDILIKSSMITNNGSFLLMEYLSSLVIKNNYIAGKLSNVLPHFFCIAGKSDTECIVILKNNEFNVTGSTDVSVDRFPFQSLFIFDGIFARKTIEFIGNRVFGGHVYSALVVSGHPIKAKAIEDTSEDTVRIHDNVFSLANHIATIIIAGYNYEEGEASAIIVISNNIFSGSTESETAIALDRAKGVEVTGNRLCSYNIGIDNRSEDTILMGNYITRCNIGVQNTVNGGLSDHGNDIIHCKNTVSGHKMISKDESQQQPSALIDLDSLRRYMIFNAAEHTRE